MVNTVGRNFLRLPDQTRYVLSADNSETGLTTCGKAEAVNTYTHNVQMMVTVIQEGLVR